MKEHNTFKVLREELTNENNHTDALIVECLEMYRYDLVAELAEIAKLQDTQGFITPEQQELRDVTIVNRMVNGN